MNKLTDTEKRKVMFSIWCCLFQSWLTLEKWKEFLMHAM